MAQVALQRVETLQTRQRLLQRVDRSVGDGRRRYYTVPSGMALWEVSLAVYGTAARVRDLLGANTITDPLAVPAGTVVTVLPA